MSHFAFPLHYSVMILRIIRDFAKLNKYGWYWLAIHVMSAFQRKIIRTDIELTSDHSYAILT